MNKENLTEQDFKTIEFIKVLGKPAVNLITENGEEITLEVDSNSDLLNKVLVKFGKKHGIELKTGDTKEDKQAALNNWFKSMPKGTVLNKTAPVKEETTPEIIPIPVAPVNSEESEIDDSIKPDIKGVKNLKVRKNVKKGILAGAIVAGLLALYTGPISNLINMFKINDTVKDLIDAQNQPAIEDTVIKDDIVDDGKMTDEERAQAIENLRNARNLDETDPLAQMGMHPKEDEYKGVQPNVTEKYEADFKEQPQDVTPDQAQDAIDKAEEEFDKNHPEFDNGGVDKDVIVNPETGEESKEIVGSDGNTHIEHEDGSTDIVDNVFDYDTGKNETLNPDYNPNPATPTPEPTPTVPSGTTDVENDKDYTQTENENGNDVLVDEETNEEIEVEQGGFDFSTQSANTVDASQDWAAIGELSNGMIIELPGDVAYETGLETGRSR